MSQEINCPSRRRFLEIAVLGAGALPFAVVVLPGSALAQDLPHLDEADPTAAALGYRADGAKVDKAKYPNFKPEQTCANCKLVLGKDGDAWRPCSIYPGKAVAAPGWCAAWAAKA